jgi:enoyl-CoA hydratase/carnithine racemase
MRLLSPADLPALAADPQPPASPLSDRALLLIDSRDASAFDDPSTLDWLLAVPAPVLAVGGPRSRLAEACDVHVEDEAEAAVLAAAIQAHPLAATVLVQALRLGEKLMAEDTLVVESLAYASLQTGSEFRRWQAGFKPPPSPLAEEGPAVCITRDGATLELVLNRPGNRNAMTVEMRDALIEALSLALIDDSIDAVRISASGRCFSTGGDLREFGSAPDPATAHAVRSLALPGRLLQRLAARATVFLHGACIGSGIEFPAFAGRVVARPDAWFQLPELRYGLIPGAGGTLGIRRRIGRQRTAWLALSGRRIDSRQALDWGLVDAIEAPDC